MSTRRWRRSSWICEVSSKDWRWRDWFPWISSEELPTLQGWGIGIVGQTSTSTKLTSEPTKDAVEDEDKPARKPESQLEPDPTHEECGSPQPTILNDMVVAARRILSENLDIAQWMLEHLKLQPGKPLRPEEFQTMAKPIEDQPWGEEARIQELAVASPSNRPSPKKSKR